MRFTTGGGERTRTVDFYIANVALYQLSYTPGCVAETSRRRPTLTLAGSGCGATEATQGGDVVVVVGGAGGGAPGAAGSGMGKLHMAAAQSVGVVAITT